MLKFYSMKITRDFLLHCWPGQVLNKILETLSVCVTITYLEMLPLWGVSQVPMELFRHIRGNPDSVIWVSLDNPPVNLTVPENPQICSEDDQTYKESFSCE